MDTKARWGLPAFRGNRREINAPLIGKVKGQVNPVPLPFSVCCLKLHVEILAYSVLLFQSCLNISPNLAEAAGEGAVMENSWSAINE